MRAYDVALFIHLLGVVTWFIAIGIVQRGGARVRGAQTVQEVRLWTGLLRTTRPMFPSGAVMLLLTGMYMADQAWSFSTPWILVAIVSLVAIALAGPLLVGRNLGKIGQAAGRSGDGPVPPELARLIAEPTPWLAATAINGAAIGLLWLMATKPDWAASIGVVVGLTVIGAIIGSVLVRRTAAPAPAGAR